MGEVNALIAGTEAWIAAHPWAATVFAYALGVWMGRMR